METQKKTYSLKGEAARFTADGKSLFVMSEKVLECDPATGKVVKDFPRPKPHRSWLFARFSSDGKRYVTFNTLEYQLYDTATGFEPARLQSQNHPFGRVDDGQFNHIFYARSALFAPNGKRVIGIDNLRGGNHDQDVTVWDAETGVALKSIGSKTWAAAISPD